MAAPIAKGLIITASVLVAAGIAFYENEHIREFILSYRRKLAIALHSLGDEINPTSQSRSDSETDELAAAEARRRRREEIVRLNRLEMIRQAREEGIAVDLDELVKLGEAEQPAVPSAQSTTNSPKGFDALVGADGTLRQAAISQSSDAVGHGLRYRGPGARGLDSGVSSANPFDDEAQIFFDRETIGCSQQLDQPKESRETSRTLSPGPPESITESQYYSEEEMEAQIEEAIRRSMHDETIKKSHSSAPIDSVSEATPSFTQQSPESSFYYAPPLNVHQPPASAQSMYSSAMEAMLQANLHQPLGDDADDEAPTPSGTLTPTEDGQSTAASLIDSHAEDIARMSDFQSIVDDNDIDARSEATSEAFSVVGGISTPGSWTDVESEAGEEDGHHIQHLNQSTNTQ